MFPVCHVFLSVYCSFVVASWCGFLAILYVMFCCVFVSFPCGVLGQVRHLIVSIPDLCLLSYFDADFTHESLSRQVLSHSCW